MHFLGKAFEKVFEISNTLGKYLIQIFSIPKCQILFKRIQIYLTPYLHGRQDITHNS